MNDRILLCLNNNGHGIMNVYKNETSCIDLTLVDKKIASRCECEISKHKVVITSLLHVKLVLSLRLNRVMCLKDGI